MNKIEVSLVNHCDNGCQYCPSMNKNLNAKSRVRYMTLDLAKEYFSKVEQPAQIFLGGHSDPMRAPEIYEIVKYLSEEGFFVFILTTLHKVDKKTVRKVFSIPKVHARLHLVDADGNTNMKLSDDLIKSYEIAIRLINSGGGSISACCWGTLPTELEHLQGAFAEPIMTNTNTLCDFGGNITHKWAKPYYISGPIKCRRNHICTHLLPDGRVSMCETDWALNHIIGDLNTNTYAEILNGKLYAEYKELLLSQNDECVCRHCTDAIPID